MKRIQNTIRRLRIPVFCFIFVFFGVFSVAPAVQAGYWGESIQANLMLYNLQRISEKIRGIILSAVKNAAIQTINKQVLRLVNGSSGKGSLIIENWRKFIYTQSAKKAEGVILNDFFPKMFSGKGSGGNYSAASEGVSGNLNSSLNTIKNYPQYLQNVGKNTLKSLQQDVTKYTLDKVCPDPKGSLAKGDYACFSSLMEPQNNPKGIPIITAQKYGAEKAKNEKIAETQAGITGYKPQTNKQGLVVTPPQTIADIVSTIQTLPAKAIALAQNWEELATGVIQSYVNSLIQKTLSKTGLGSDGADFSNNLSNELTRQTGGVIRDGVKGVKDYFSEDGSGSDIVGPNDVGDEDEDWCGVTHCQDIR